MDSASTAPYIFPSVQENWSRRKVRKINYNNVWWFIQFGYISVFDNLMTGNIMSTLANLFNRKKKCLEGKKPLHDGVDLVWFLVLDPVRDSIQEPQLIVRNILLRDPCSLHCQVVVIRAEYMKSSHFNLSNSSLHLIWGPELGSFLSEGCSVEVESPSPGSGVSEGVFVSL